MVLNSASLGDWKIRWLACDTRSSQSLLQKAPERPTQQKMESVLWFMDNAYKYQDELLSWPVTIIGTVGYLGAVLLGKRLMKNREKFGLKTLMTVHNVVLFIWSVAMCAGGFYETYMAFSKNSFMDVYCSANSRPGSDRIMTGKAWFWIWLFFASKFYEFADTAFIVLRKSPLIFLHVYVRPNLRPTSISPFPTVGSAAPIPLSLPSRSYYPK